MYETITAALLMQFKQDGPVELEIKRRVKGKATTFTLTVDGTDTPSDLMAQVTKAFQAIGITPPPQAEEMGVEIIEGWKCRECDHVSESCREGVRLYECQECSEKFTNEEGGGKNGNMCPSCGNKFGSRVDADEKWNNVCEECNEGLCDKVDVYRCPCPDCEKEFHELGDTKC